MKIHALVFALPRLNGFILCWWLCLKTRSCRSSSSHNACSKRWHTTGFSFLTLKVLHVSMDWKYFKFFYSMKYIHCCFTEQPISIAFPFLQRDKCFSWFVSLVPFTCIQQRQLFANLDSRSWNDPASWAIALQSRLSISCRQAPCHHSPGWRTGETYHSKFSTVIEECYFPDIIGILPLYWNTRFRFWQHLNIV